MQVADDVRDDAIEALAAVSTEAPTFDQYHSSLRLPAPDGSQTLLNVVRRLDERGIAVQDIALHKPTLDDVFLTLTGRGAEEAEAESEKVTTPKRRGSRARSN